MRSTPFLPIVLATMALARTGVAEQPGKLEGHVREGQDGAQQRRNPLLPWRPLPPSGVVAQNVELLCEKGCLLELEGGNSVRLTAGAMVTLGDYFFVPLEAGKAMVKAQQVFLRDGIVEVEAPAHDTAKPVVVISKGGMVALRGGSARVLAHEDQTVATGQGTVRVSSGGNWADLVAGHEGVLSGKGRPATDRIVPAAPTWRYDAPECKKALVFVRMGGLGLTESCWNTQSGSMRYRVEYSRDPEFTNIVDTADVTATHFAAKPLPPGRYWQRVRAIDELEMWGGMSSSKPLAIVHVEGPAGAMAGDDGSVLGNAGDVIKLGDTTGLEVIRERGVVTPAPAALTLDSSRAVQDVQMRMAADHQATANLPLSLRSLKATIRMTPNGARWPRDPVDIAVTLQDPTGRVDTAELTPTLHVLIGTTETKVPWIHDGSQWITRIAPRRMYGPTVVRVTAEDAQGGTIGRSFLEIDGDTSTEPTIIEGKTARFR